MTYFADLSECTYFGSEFAEKLRAVGWLEHNKNHSTGEVSEKFFERLCELLGDPWNPIDFCGSHECDFCRFSQKTNENTKYKKREIKITSCVNLFVPGDGFIYVAPELIAHYIDAHNYSPPEEFCRAVMRCPEMSSKKYLKAMLKNGGKKLREIAKSKYQMDF